MAGTAEVSTVAGPRSAEVSVRSARSAAPLTPVLINDMNTRLDPCIYQRFLS